MTLGNEHTELSERELDILRLVATGASNKEIAQQLFISTNTVKVHLRNIFAKIGVVSRTEAALYALRMGIVEQVSQGEVAELLQDVEGMAAGGEPLTAKPGWLDHRPNRFLLLGVALLVVALLAVFLSQVFTPGGVEVSGMPLPTSAPRWQPMAEMPTPRSGLALAAYDNIILAIGGESSQGVLGTVEVFNPEANQWSGLADKPLPVTDVSAAVLGGLIYIPGGRLASGAMTSIVEVYDPRKEQWESRAPLPLSLSAYALSAYEGRLYLFGGWDGENYLDSVYRYDPGQDVWETMTPMPTARAYCGAVLAASKIYVIGGFNGQQALDVNEIYFPDRDQAGDQPWIVGAAMPSRRYGMGVSSVADLIQVIGGQGEADTTVSYQYSPPGDNWIMIESPATLGWSNMAVVHSGTQLFAIGGRLGETPTGISMKYQAIYTVLMPLVR